MKNATTILCALFLTVSFLLSTNVSSSVFSNAKIIYNSNNQSPQYIWFKANQKPHIDTFLNELKSNFNLNETIAFLPIDKKTDHLGQTHHIVNQLYKNIEIADVRLLIHEENGLVHFTNGNIITGLNLDINPTLSEAQAFQFALENINAKKYSWEIPESVFFNTDMPTGKLMISAGNSVFKPENFHLVYRFKIYTVIPFGGYTIDIDANTGKVIGKHSLVYHKTLSGTGETLYNGPQPIKINDALFPKPPYAHLNNWNAFGNNGSSWWFADTVLGNDGGYDDMWYQVLDTDTLTLVGENYYLSFYQRYATEAYTPSPYNTVYDGFDGMNIRISLDNGDTWQVLQNPDVEYNSTNLYSFCFIHNEREVTPGWSGNSLDWQKVTFDLSSYSGHTIAIRFAFASDDHYATSSNLPDCFGWQIDEIAIVNSDDTLFYNSGIIQGLTPESIITEAMDSCYILQEHRNSTEMFTYTTVYQNGDYSNPVFANVKNPDTNFNESVCRSGVSVHWATEKTLDYYLNKFNRKSYDGNSAPLYSAVNYIFYYSVDDIVKTDAAWGGTAAFFGPGDGKTSDSWVSIDVVGHEITHGVTASDAGLLYENESGALHESFSDIFGTAIEFYIEGSNADWTFLEDVMITDPRGRSLENPKSKFDPDTYKGQYWISKTNNPNRENDRGGIHTNCGVMNHWFYLLSEGGSGTNDNEFSYSFNGIGIEQAEQITYRNLTTYLVPTSGFEDARLGSMQAAIDLFGENSDQHRAVINAWNAVGVIKPYWGAYAESIILDNTFKIHGQDTLQITAEIQNPYNHSLEVKAIIKDLKSTISDSLELFDNGIGTDSVTNDNKFSGCWIVPSGERTYKINIKTFSQENDIENLNDDISRFTTIGPVTTTHKAYTGEDYDSTDNLHGFLLILENKSTETIAEDLTVTLTTNDSRVKEITDGTKNFPDLDPGEIDTCADYNIFTFKYIDTYGPDSTIDNPIKFDVSISSDHYPYWTSSFDFIASVGVGIDISTVDRIHTYELFQNYPNPFNPTTTIEYWLPISSKVQLIIYNVLGQKVTTLISEKQNAGMHKVLWDASEFSSGVYLYKLITDKGFCQTHKLLFLK